MIKKILRKNLYFLYFINLYHCFLSKVYPKIISDENAVKRYYKKFAKKELNLYNPICFSEKQQWYKLNNKNHLMEICADKYEVRNYIKEMGYSDLLNNIIALYYSVNDIDIGTLPEKFVLKATHGSGFNLIVKNKQQVNWFMWKKIMKLWLKQDIYWSGREWVYKNLKPRIIAENYLEDETGELRDYKFFCFNGKPQFMQLEVGRYAKQKTRNFYNMNWELMPFGKEIPHNTEIVVERPSLFDEMKEIAIKLSSPFSFVRVDLYQVGQKVYFGELTFFPAGGAPDFVPSEYDELVGGMWDLKQN